MRKAPSLARIAGWIFRVRLRVRHAFQPAAADHGLEVQLQSPRGESVPLGRARKCARRLCRRSDFTSGGARGEGSGEGRALGRHREPLRDWRNGRRGPGHAHPSAVTTFRPKTRWCCSAGSFVELQALDLLIDAVPLVLQKVPNVAFLMVGGAAPEIAKLRAQAERLGVGEDRVVMEESRPQGRRCRSTWRRHRRSPAARSAGIPAIGVVQDRRRRHGEALCGASPSPA